jgi:hypothetical protein
MGHTLVPHHHDEEPYKPGKHHHHGSKQNHHHDHDEKQDPKSESNDQENHPGEFGKHITKPTYFSIDLPEQVIEHLDLFQVLYQVSFSKSRILHPPITNSIFRNCLLRHSLSRRGPPAHA